MYAHATALLQWQFLKLHTSALQSLSAVTAVTIEGRGVIYYFCCRPLTVALRRLFGSPDHQEKWFEVGNRHSSVIFLTELCRFPTFDIDRSRSHSGNNWRSRREITSVVGLKLWLYGECSAHQTTKKYDFRPSTAIDHKRTILLR
jgi:hypothetical protein